MHSNPSHKSLGKTLINIIRRMQNIGFTTSPDRTKIAPETLGELLNIWLIISLPSVHESPMVFSVLFPEHIHLYFQDIFVSTVGKYMV